jgi:histidinol phosphatase-like enzyme
LKAKADFSIDLAFSWMIGDRDADILCGQAAGVKTILINGAKIHHIPRVEDYHTFAHLSYDPHIMGYHNKAHTQSGLKVL